MAQVVHFRGSRADVTRVAHTLAAILSGRQSDSLGLGIGFVMSLGFAALSDIKDAFVTKSSGGTDEMGITWPELAPSTIANRRVGAGDRGVGKRITRLPGQSTLDAAQQALLVRNRERIRTRETKKALIRFELSGLEPKEALRRARIVGGLKATRETGKTKVQTLGGRQVEILRDRGFLLNSLSPGTLSGSAGLTNYSKPAGDGGEEQIFEASAGQIIVGTNIVYAGTHQHGNEERNIPARPFLPDEQNPVPALWWDRWSGVAVQSLAVAARILFARGAA